MALLNSINSLFETAEQRAEREKYEAERKAFFESIPKRAEQTLIVGQPIESLVEELRRQLSELGVLRTLDQQRIAALESDLELERMRIAACGHHHLLILKSAETGDPLYCELCDLRDRRNDLESDLATKEAECGQLRADAERYRWLRDCTFDKGANEVDERLYVACDDYVYRGKWALHGDDLDAAIDAGWGIACTSLETKNRLISKTAVPTVALPETRPIAATLVLSLSVLPYR